MLAWWNGRSLRLADSIKALINLPPHSKIEMKVSPENKVVRERVTLQTNPRAVMWCVAINEGDGFRIFGGFESEYVVQGRLREALGEFDNLGKAPSRPAKPSLKLPIKSDVGNWLESARSSLIQTCHQIASIDQRFATLWKEHEGAENEWSGWPPVIEFPHSLNLAIDAFTAFAQLQNSLTIWFEELLAFNHEKPKSTQLQTLRPFILKVSQQAHRAGELAQALHGFASGHRTLSTLGANKNIQSNYSGG